MTGKIRGLPQAPGVVRIKGSHMSYYSPFYQRWITKSWPKGNGGDTPRRAAARAAFIDATQKIKSNAPELWQAAEEWAANSPYLARDLLMASAMGTFSEITMADGTTKVSLRVTNRTIQQLLDSIGFQIGTLLARTGDEWQALLPGDAGDVLTMNGSTGLPDWAPSSGGGTGYDPGAPPTVRQVAFSQTNGVAPVFADAPLEDSLLVAIYSSPSTYLNATGWTTQSQNTSGTDYGRCYTKTAGAGESATQFPVTTVPATFGCVIWELPAVTGVTPTFILGQSQAEAAAALTSTPVILPNLTDCLTLNFIAAQTTADITNVYNAGTLDVLSNGGGRNLAAGHANLADTPMGGLAVRFAAANASKSHTVIIAK